MSGVTIMWRIVSVRRSRGHTGGRSADSGHYGLGMPALTAWAWHPSLGTLRWACPRLQLGHGTQHGIRRGVAAGGLLAVFSACACLQVHRIVSG